MLLSIFFKLESFFSQYKDLQNLRYVNISENILIFIFVVRYKYTNRKIQKKFQFYNDYVNHCIQPIFKTILFFDSEYILLLEIPYLLSDHIILNPMFTYYFNDGFVVINYK